MKVSIIVPVYNVDKYLPRCLQSIKEQTYQDMEIILIDDGSSDTSGDLCDKYAESDERTIVIHKKNGGLSSARNTGIDRASGDAIFFLDSDDYITVSCIEKLVDLLEKNNADISIIQMKYIQEKVNEEIYNQREIQNIEFNAEQAIEASLYQVRFTCCAPAKLYKKYVIEGIFFPEGRLSEDLATCHLFLNRAKKVIYSTEYGYFYRQREGSIMHEFNPRRMDALEWALDIEKFCRGEYEHIVKAAECRTFNVAVHILLELPNRGEVHDRFYRKIWKQILRTRKTVLKDKQARGREKAAALLSYGGERLMKKVWNSGIAVKKT